METIEAGYMEYHLRGTVAWVALLTQGKSVCGSTYDVLVPGRKF